MEIIYTHIQILLNKENVIVERKQWGKWRQNLSRH